ncbi:MAG: HpcH/HpaI aldolase/citrate lyase family protein [Pirellulales bacterium]
MKTNGIKQRLAKNEPCFITTLHLADPTVYELASSIGIEGIWLDMEHRAFNLETVQKLMTAARAGGTSDVIVRTSRHELQLITRVLECGAQGVIYPRCSDAEEAREVVRAAKFAPLGVRGCDGWGRDAPFGQMPLEQYVRAANAETLIVIQIETPEALENAAAIAQVEGVDVLMFGMGDFSVLSGVPGQVRHPTVLDASRRVCDAALKAGKHFGQPVGSMEAAEELIAMGGRMLFHNADVLMIDRGLRNMQEQIARLRSKLGY